MSDKDLEALEKAAQVWCQETTKHIEMDSVLAAEFAKTLMPYIEKIASLTRDNALIANEVEKLSRENAALKDNIAWQKKKGAL